MVHHSRAEVVIYTAGTVLVLIMRASALQQMLTDEIHREMQITWRTCLEVLEHYHRNGIEIAAKCMAMLRKIYEDGELERQQQLGMPHKALEVKSFDRFHGLMAFLLQMYQGSLPLTIPGMNLNSQRHANSNTKIDRNQPGEHTSSDHSTGHHESLQPINTEMPEFWWASGDMEWLDNLLDIGQPSGQCDGSNALMTLYS